MTFISGTKLGPYEILSAIGAGGMGEVYKARDTRLNRTVAIKVLPSHFSDNAEMKSRFDREAQTIAGLNHPHICVLHDVGHQDGTDYLVMEYLEGQTLAQRLEKGALPLDEALKIAIEIADALDKAHRQGVVHRDLKPSNVMLTKSGAKLLDFGLAKLKQETQQAPTLSALPTNADVTAKGTILGTLQYMAPEQLEGEEADASTDIFAFGAIFYEMVTGFKAFAGKSQASLISAIMSAQPQPLSQLQPLTPTALEHLVITCLSKEPDERWRTAHDVLIQLRWIERRSTETIAGPATATRRKREIAAWVALLIVVAFSGFVLLERRTTIQPAKVTFELPTPPATGSPLQIALSPDGKNLAAVINVPPRGVRQLWVRPLEYINALNPAGTDDASFPFWSPDGRFIAFFAEGKLKKIDIFGAPPQVLADAPVGATGSWSRDGVIVFAPSPNSPLFRVPAAGGVAAQVTELNKSRNEISHRFVHFLPDGNHFLYFGLSTSPQESGIYVGSLNSREAKRLIATQTEGQFAPPDILLFTRESTLMAQRFDTVRLELQDDPHPIAEQVMSNTGTGQAGFAVSDNGVLAYRVGRASGAGRVLVWVDGSGKTETSPLPPAAYENPKLSPDGKQLAIFKTGDIWIVDVKTGNSSRFTYDPGEDNSPVWSPDGREIVFASNRDGNVFNLYKKGSGGTTNDELLLKTPNNKTPVGWSADGKYILYDETDPKTKGDLWVLPLTGDRKPTKMIGSSFNEVSGSLSPDGRWIAYNSDETGQGETYVQTFPPSTRKWKVSTMGGARSIGWRHDSKALFYASGGGAIMAVDVTVKNGEFSSSTPRVFFQRPPIGFNPSRNNFDVSPDGRLLVLSGQGSTIPGQTPIVVVLNWKSGLKQ
jgi:serine/threonine protein kinase/Tol biopolymer transport system component